MIRKISLQNFMSYESASVPLSEGLNIVCGPNGAGKSSILLAISLVLGQSYTERAKKLSDLIRWGQNEARIALTLDNELKDGKRLFPRIRKDSVEVTRVIRKSGDYNYFIQGKVTSKSEVVSAFSKVGLNPNNMLIIMHQFMVGRFSLTSPQEKLAMLEEAVGFKSYRRDVLEALDRLKKFEIEEEKLAGALDSAKATYEFWRRERDKFLKKRELTLRLDELNREIAWLKVKRKEGGITKLSEKIKALEEQRSRSEGSAESSLRLLAVEESKYEALLKEKELKEFHLTKALEEKAWLEARLALMNALSRRNVLDSLQDNLLIGALLEEESPILGEIPSTINGFKRKLEGKLRDSVEKAIEVKSKLEGLNRALKEVTSKIIELKVNSEVEEYKVELLKREISILKGSLGIEEEELKALRAEAE
ncbi:TPA: hypothetical protein EYP26_01855, partial [Candidatus Bathyarchaeota archaeon]|nr:hypothetical protein [Candidatus Bathyarchaeota archaeon]